MNFVDFQKHFKNNTNKDIDKNNIDAKCLNKNINPNKNSNNNDIKQSKINCDYEKIDNNTYNLENKNNYNENIKNNADNFNKLNDDIEDFTKNYNKLFTKYSDLSTSELSNELFKQFAINKANGMTNKDLDNLFASIVPFLDEDSKNNISKLVEELKSDNT